MRSSWCSTCASRMRRAMPASFPKTRKWRKCSARRWGCLRPSPAWLARSRRWKRSSWSSVPATRSPAGCCSSTRTAPTGAPSRWRRIRAAPSAENRDSPYFLGEQVFALRREALAGFAGKAAFRVLVQAADRIAHHGAGAAVGVAVLGGAQRLLERRLKAVEELVHARLQPLVLTDQGVAGHDAHHARILFREGEQHLRQLLGLLAAVGLVLGDAVGEREHGSLDELDQPLVHLCLRGEVAVERGFGDAERLGERGGRDAFPFRRLEHLCERLQDLELAFAFGSGHGMGIRGSGILCRASSENQAR